jgi:hypothetical protein
MSKFEIVAESAAPAMPTGGTTPKATRVKRAVFDNYISAVPANEVGVLHPEPEKGETIKSLCLSVSHAARRANKRATTWNVDGVVYFSVEDAEEDES